MQYTLVADTEDGSNISIFVPGRDMLVAHSSHPNFGEIVLRALDGDESVVELFDIAQTAVDKFDRLTERVTTANGMLYLDGEEVHNSLATQVVRFLRDGVEEWKPLVNFFENVQANPNEHSREQLYSWLDARDFTITPDGMIVGYKGVKGSDGEYFSIWSGGAIVDGERVSGYVPNKIGSVVEMPRNEVAFDPYVGCSYGLHVGTWDYAKGFSQGAVLEVHVNPRDVVSVPTENDWAKVRVCRYKVVNVIDVPYTVPVTDYWDTDYPDEDACDYCGDAYEHCECDGLDGNDDDYGYW